MELTVLDRILLLNVMPAEGDILTLKIVRKLREGLSFTEDEHKALNIVNENGQIKWTPTTETKEIEIGPKAMILIAKVLKKLSKEEKLPAQYVDVYEKFVEEED